MAGIFGVCVATAGALTLGTLTYHRNADYHSDLSSGKIRFARPPAMPAPTTTSAVALADRGRVDEAITHYRKALEIKPDYAEAHNNSASLWGRGQIDEAITHFQQGWKSSPTSPRPTTILVWLWPAAGRSMRPSPVIGRRWRSSLTSPRPTTILAGTGRPRAGR